MGTFKERQEISTAQRYRDDPLYQELGAIGRRRFPLDPVGLVGRKHICDSPEVRRRAGADASPERLAFSASLAIRESVEVIADRDLREIARAVFGFNEYADRAIEARKVLLDQRYGISRDVYKRRRSEAISHVISFLSREDWGIPHPIVARTDDEDIWDRDHRLSNLAERAAELHYAGLINLFYRQRSRELGLRLDAEVGIKAMFDAYVGFIETTYVLFRRDTFGGQGYPLLFERERYLSSTIRACSPLSGGVEQEVTLGMSSKKRYVPNLPLFSLRYIALIENAYRVSYLEASHEAARLLHDVWTPWQMNARLPDGTTGSWSGRPSGYMVMIAKSGALVQELSTSIRFSRPVSHRARRYAYRALATNYESDEWLPMIRGQSLVDHFNAYLDNVALPIAKSSLAWCNEGEWEY